MNTHALPAHSLLEGGDSGIPLVRSHLFQMTHYDVGHFGNDFGASFFLSGQADSPSAFRVSVGVRVDKNAFLSDIGCLF